MHIDMEGIDVQDPSTFELHGDSVQFPVAGLHLNNYGIQQEDGQIIGSIQPKQIIVAEQIGAGQSSQVYKGIYQTGNQPVGLKIINVFDKQKRHQMLNDLRTLLTGYQCPNLIDFYGAYYEEGTIRIVLEYMDLGSLRNIIKQLKPEHRQKIGFESVLATIAAEILTGLRFLHKDRHQVHRDIKPENVLINSAGQIKLTDFGISKQLGNTAAITGTFVGTLIYMSPERCQGKSYSYGSDLWSLGLCIYELASGEHPYMNSINKITHIEVIRSIIKSPSPTIKCDCSDELRDFLRICLEHSEAKRLDAEALLNHPWITKYRQNNAYLSAWLLQL